MDNQIQVRDAALIVAIDFGTSYSGYAFQFYYQYEKDPTKIDSPQAFNSSSGRLASMKTSTCLLLNEGKEIDECCFGFEAEDKYMELCFNKTNKHYYFFRRFKMQLQDGQLPPTLDKQCEDNLKHGFTACLKESAHETEISLIESKLLLKPQLVEKLFRQATDQIIEHMKYILEESPVKSISHILMVGGFSESPFVQNVVREAFDGKNGLKVIIPKDAGITIAKGAVLYGRFPKIIESRVLRFTYGLGKSPRFIEGTHPEEKKIRSDTGIRCSDVFDIILSADTEVKSGFSVENKYLTIHYFQEELQLDIYYTKEKKPRFTTDPGCKLLGGLNVKIPNPSKDQHRVYVTFQFGMTELKISAREQSSKLPCTTKLTMIE
ncbi:hypothetical protein ACJMK2_039592 [Sinanodonta woodiana]|uniref:Uncharacterized protein n=1 Tax=Sinanodonta woodiana TaxID=1069815 RepID=A0ABD3WE09_SINWO